jgi:hypothetical protein
LKPCHLSPMRAVLAVVALVAALATVVPSTAQQGSVQQGSPQSWPPLPTSGFISGRPATDKDVAAGNAVFVLRAYGIAFGKPLDFTIPQYAYLTKRGQPPVPVIVVQAEQGRGIKVFGVRGLDGQTATAKESELRFLGTQMPR